MLQNKSTAPYNLKDAVKLPIGEKPEEWIANNIFDFHKQICMLFGTIKEDCTPSKCPEMTAGKRHKFSWSTSMISPAEEVCASDYICHILDWVQEQLDDEEVFPSRSDSKEFPSSFLLTCRTIVRRLLRVYAHTYHHHLPLVKEYKEEAHLNTSFKHFIYFAQEFDLITANELEPLSFVMDRCQFHFLDGTNRHAVVKDGS